MLLQSVGAKDDPASGGRQMPSHWGQPKLNIVERSSTAGMQWLQAVGAAEAALYFEAEPAALAQAQQAPLGQHVRHERDEVVYVSGGEGMTSEGEFSRR
jgi:2-oxoisovalerate dehydrogenase E1 component